MSVYAICSGEGQSKNNILEIEPSIGWPRGYHNQRELCKQIEHYYSLKLSSVQFLDRLSNYLVHKFRRIQTNGNCFLCPSIVRIGHSLQL